MKVHPLRTSLLYIHDLLYVNLCHSQVWEAEKRPDGKYDLRHGCVTIVIDEEAYEKFFGGKESQ